MPSLRPLVAAAALAGGACGARTTPIAPIVLAYDASTADSISRLLLLNIARARHNEPMHFTTLSNIVATYKFTVSGGFVAAVTGDRGFLPVPQLGGTAEENPTLSISPMQGDEFTQRLLTPFEGAKLTLLLRQGYDVDSLFRMLAGEVFVVDAGGALAGYANRPANRDSYAAFRRVIAHLSSIQDQHGLYVEPLHFEYEWTLPESAVTPCKSASERSVWVRACA